MIIIIIIIILIKKLVQRKSNGTEIEHKRIIVVFAQHHDACRLLNWNYVNYSMEWLSRVWKIIVILEYVPERQSIASLDCYGNPLKEELCLEWFWVDRGDSLSDVVCELIVSEFQEPPVSRAWNKVVNNTQMFELLLLLFVLFVLLLLLFLLLLLLFFCNLGSKDPEG